MKPTTESTDEPKSPTPTTRSGISDAEIAYNADHMIRWTTVDPKALRVKVDHGWVTLRGEASCDAERCGLVESIRPLQGVAGVTNEVGLAPDHAPEHDDISVLEAAIRAFAGRT
ncbi:MAG TPA: BON domain-containing protein [Burkholderiaceae bacterium]|nr:BON domain-containing protein [Burkholderiaceae bacterium]